MKIISWNMQQKHLSWRRLFQMDIDLALLQEVGKPPPDVAERIEADPAIEIDSASWQTIIVGGRTSYRTAIVKLSDRIEVEWIEARSIDEAKPRDLVVSWPGTLTAAIVNPASGAPVLAISMYAQWLRTHTLAASNLIFSDSSAHRVISDLSVFIAKEDGHRVLAAGDLNILRGYGEHGSAYWAVRYKTVFDRMEAMGLPCIGPEYPNGRQPHPWPDELPRDSRNVPTFHSNLQSQATATRQLDYVFASTRLADSLKVRALNRPEEWGPSDHCRIEIGLAEGN